MSRIGKLPIGIPSGVKVSLTDELIEVTGPKGTLRQSHIAGIDIKVEADQILVTRQAEDRFSRSKHGLTRSLVANMCEGVTKGYEKILEINGVGYRAELKGTVLGLALGYSHPIEYQLPVGITVEVEKQTKVTVRGIDKQLVGETAAKIRSFRQPEPYKGKGIKYSDEKIIRKAGKAGK